MPPVGRGPHPGAKGRYQQRSVGILILCFLRALRVFQKAHQLIPRQGVRQFPGRLRLVRQAGRPACPQDACIPEQQDQLL